MTLTLYYHPFAAYCWKVLIALYENDTPFTPVEIDLGDPEQRARLAELWPPTLFPVLTEESSGLVLPESSIIIEYLGIRHPGPFRPIPADPDRSLEVRLWDRCFDSYVMTPMQAIVFDRLRPADSKDPLGAEKARATLDMAYRMLDARMADRTWAAGEDFTMADCAAAPSLHYAERVHPFDSGHSHLALYLARLKARPSVARVLREAQPYEHFFPQ
jgi:glutathione S-transferase